MRGSSEYFVDIVKTDLQATSVDELNDGLQTKAGDALQLNARLTTLAHVSRQHCTKVVAAGYENVAMNVHLKTTRNDGVITQHTVCSQGIKSNN